MRRLFSTFADGLPGAGLLMLRFFLGGALMLSAIGAVLHGSSMIAAAANVLAAVAGVFLLLGLWTPIGCMAVAVTELWIVFFVPCGLTTSPPTSRLSHWIGHDWSRRLVARCSPLRLETPRNPRPKGLSSRLQRARVFASHAVQIPPDKSSK